MAYNMHKVLWSFSCMDNGGKLQAFTVKAPDKQSAIEKGMARAKRHAAGDITTWHCSLSLIK